MKHLFTLSERLRAKWESFATLATFAMQSLKATKRQSDTTIFAESAKVPKCHDIFAESVKVSKCHDIFANYGVKDVMVSLGQYPTNIQLISNLSPTVGRYFTRFAAVFALVFVMGVGNVWGAVPTGWTQVTALNGMSAGDKIIIVTNNGNNYLNGSVASGHFSTTALSASAPASASAAGVILLESTGTANKYKLKLVSTNKYITATATKSGSASVSATSDSYGWTFTSSNSTFSAQFQETGKQAHLRSYNNATFRTYSSASNDAFKIYKYSSTPSYTITASSNNNSWGTVSVSGTTITATPADCYQVASGTSGYNKVSGTGTITHTGNSNTISVTPTSNCSIQVIFEKKIVNTYIDEIQDNGEFEDCSTSAPSLTDKSAATTGTCAQQHYHFVGWVTAANKANPTAQNIVAGGSTIAVNGTTYYAVWAKGSSGGGFDNTTGGIFKIYADVSGTKHYAVGTGSKISSTTNAAEATEYTFEKQSAGVYYIKTGSDYIKYASSTNLGTQTDGYSWTITAATHGSWRVTSGTSGRAWIYRAGSTNQFGGYSTSNVNGTEYFDLEIDGGYTYTDYKAVCCTALGQIKGTVNLDQLATPAEGKLKASWQLEETTGIGSLKLQLWKKGSPDAKVGEDINVTVNTTAQNYTFEDLDYCATYYAKLIAAKDGGTYCTDGWIETSGEATTLGYAVELTDDGTVTGGTFTTNKARACAGETVTLTATPSSGYLLGGWTVLDGNADKITPTSTTTNTFVFTMPASGVVAEATFCTQPTAPTGLSRTLNADATRGKTVLSWNSVTGATGYVLNYTKDAVAQTPINVNTTSYTFDPSVNPLALGAYTWSVKAKNACGESTAANGEGFIICTDLSSTTPTVGAATSVSQTTATANWTAVAGAAKYTVQVYNGESMVVEYANETGTSKAVTGLTANTTYVVKVTAYNACGEASLVGSSEAFTTPKNVYVVSFNANGGTGSIAVVNVTDGESTTLPSSGMTRAGYTLSGWKANNEGDLLAKGASYTVTAAVTMYAQWSANTITVTYKANGPTADDASEQFTYGNTYNAKAANTFSYSGYQFKHWNSAANGTGEVTLAAGASYTGTADITLYAIWDQLYTVEWYVNGTRTSYQTAISGTAMTYGGDRGNSELASCGTNRFMGWSESELKGTGHDAPSDLFTSATKPTTISADKTYYAVFAKDNASTVFEDDMSDGVTSRTGWSSFATCYSETGGGSSCVRMSSGSTGGVMTMSANANLTSPATITFKILHYGSEDGKVALSASKGTFSTTDFTASSGSSSWQEVSSTLTGCDKTTTITFTGTTKKRIYIKDISIVCGSTEDYQTGCCTPLGVIDGDITLSNAECGAGELKATWKMKAVTGIASQVLHIYKASDDSEVTAKEISGIEPSTSNQTQTISDLENCTAYYVKVENIAATGDYCASGWAGDASGSATTKGYTYSVPSSNIHLVEDLPESTCANGGADVAIQFTAATGYRLPTSDEEIVAGVNVTNVGEKDEDWFCGVENNILTINLSPSKATGNIAISVTSYCVPPTFTVHPQSKIDYLTSDVATALGYTASAAGAGLTQQWQISSNNVDWDDITGEAGTAATYTPNIATAGTKYYRVIVTSACGETATSDPATITSTEPSGYCISVFNSNNDGILSGFNNGGSGSEYRLAFTVPGKDGSSNWPQYWIGENNAWASYSANANFADMKFTSSNATLGLAEGATGTLHIWDDNKAIGSNLHAKFEPSGYGFRWGDHNSDDWTAEACTKAFTVDANNANTYWTELVTLDGTNNTAWDYYVGLQTASGYIYSGVDNEASDARGISRTRSVTTMKVSNGTAGQYKATNLDSEPAGAQGKFRIWNNNIEDYNFVCHFVPFYQLKYNANGGSGDMAAIPATPVSCEESAANRTVTVAANAFTAPTGKQFVKWNTANDGSGADVAEGAYELTGDVTLYAIWADADYTVTVNQSPAAGATTTGQTTEAHYGGTINLTTTVPEGYKFVNWTSSDVTITNQTSEDGASFTMPAKNVTVTANFQQIYTITWSANGATTTSTVNAGNKLVLPASDPTSCNAGYSTFIGWYSDPAGSAEDPSDNISGTKADADHTPTGNETWYAVWANGELVGGWQKVTSIAVGDVVLFVHDVATKKELTGVADNIGTATSYDTELAGSYPLTVMEGSVDDSYAFKNGNNYLSYSGSGNNLYTSTELTAASSWTISTSTDGNFRFANANTTTRILQFNNNQYRWACYGNSSQAAFQIYKQIASATEFISGCCTDWSAPAISYSIPDHWKAGDGDVAVSIAPGTTYGAVSFASSDDAVLTVDEETGAIHAVAVGTATVTATWTGGVVDAVRYCTAQSTSAEISVSGTVTITFNGNDATSGSMDNQVIYYNEATALSANAFARTGYTFYGWAETEEKADAGNRDYEGGESVTFTTNKTLYAVWQANKHKVTLTQPTGNTIEATGAADLANVGYGTSITLSAEENDGYVFTGWSASGVDLANTNPVVFTMPDNDVTVTATYSTYEWIVADPRYTVTTAPKIEYYKVEKFSTAGVVIKENFKRSDDNTKTKQETYTGAWTAKLDGVAIVNDAALSLDDNNKTLKLYIGEDEIASYTLKVNDIVADLFIDGLWGETFDPQINTYDMPTPEAHDAGAVATCKDHNIFVGWVLEANMYDFVEDNIIKGTATKDITAANNTYYAVWAKQVSGLVDRTMKYSWEAGESTTGWTVGNTTPVTSVSSSAITPHDGSKFVHSASDMSFIKTSTAIENPQKLTIYVARTSNNKSNTVFAIQTCATANGNYSDVAVKDIDDLTSKDTWYKFEADLTSYQNVFVNFIKRGGGSANRAIDDVTLTYKVEDTYNTDYITDCETRYDIEFDVNGAEEGSYETLSRKANATITLPSGSVLSKTHYSFAGWYSASYDEVFAGSASYTVPSGGDILEAQWTEDHHAFVHFMNGESEVAGSPIKVYDGGLFNLAAAPSKDNNEFIGWKWNETIYAADLPNQHMDNPAEDRTYTAVWMPVIDVAATNLSDGKWILVQNKSQLKAGDFIVIAATGYNVALSTTQNNSNRSAAAVTKTMDTLTYDGNVAPLFLQYDPENDYYALYDRANTGYLFSNNNLKTQDGLSMQALWRIEIANKKASIVAQGNNNEKTMRYNIANSGIFSTYGSASDQNDIAIYKWAKNISSDMDVSDVTNTDIVIVTDGNTLTIDEPATLDNLIVEAGGEVSGSAALTVNNLTLKTSLGTINGDDNTGGKSGEILNPENINAQGEVWIEIELTQETQASAGWYAFSVPFPVDALNGVYYGNTKLQNEVGYAIMSHYGDLRAQNEYAWKKFRGIMQPGEFYVITVGNTDYKTLRFKKVAGTKIFNEGNVVSENQMAITSYPSSDTYAANWNGMGNPYLETAKVGSTYMQFYDHSYNVFRQRTGSDVQLMVGSAFFLQSAASTISVTRSDEGSILLAPARTPKAIEKTIFEVRLNDENGREADNLFLTAREDAMNEYEIGHDVAKLSMGTAKCAQMWVPAYGTQLCAADFQLVNDKAIYPLSINTPKEGTYFISAVENENATIYLTYNGKSIWNLSMSACEVELTKGLNEGYGLKLVVKAPQTPTGIDDVQSDKVQCTKVVLDDHVYILRGGQMYDVTGKMVK